VNSLSASMQLGSSLNPGGNLRRGMRKRKHMQTAYKSIRLFKNDFFEWFSHIHPLTPLVFWGPIASWFIWRGYSHDGLSLLAVLTLGAGGLLTWSLAEYVLHRFVFHFKPTTPAGERWVFIMHGIHHADPMDPTRLVMAPLVAFLLAAIFYPIFWAVLGAELVSPFFGFFIVGYLCYDYTHYAVHHFTQRTSWGKSLKQNHMLHHYVNHDLRWGVSTPLWDYVFGTFTEPTPVKKPRARTAATPAESSGEASAESLPPESGRDSTEGPASEAKLNPV
jgi:sterol desaturase/sphingolipid hydroxylase (fatty acid hydroxylase superfamily)